jgi:beta-lactamase regulating signal transducer with metallopeptidase domain
MADPNLGLQAASGLVNFLLKTTVEWLVCLALVRLAGSARWRFNLWLTMLLAFVAQWGGMWVHLARVAFPWVPVAGVTVPLPHIEAARRISVAQPVAGTVAAIMASLAIAYVAGLAWRGLGSAAARVRLARALSLGRVPGDHVAAAFDDVVREVQAGGVQLWVLPGIESPATLGWWRPKVVVPPVCEIQDEQEVKAVFWHELKHVQRNDALWNAVAMLCRNLLWFHPAIHHAAAELKVQRELACDAEVVREHPQELDVYASCLLRFARAEGVRERSIAMVEMASAPALLTRRIRSILSERPRISVLSRACRAVANVVLIAVMAATVPGLNVLFAEYSRTPMLQIPVTSMEDRRAQTGVRHPARRATVQQRLFAPDAATQSRVAELTSAALPAVAHDEALAAEHRAAAGILTQSTGMDVQGTPEARVDATGVEKPRNVSARTAAASLGSVAIDAAERMGPLMGDHDGNRH